MLSNWGNNSMPIIINKTLVDTAPAGEHREGKLSGFVLDVGKSGVKTYKVHSRIKGGKLITYTIGPHGDPWNSTSARQEADRILHMMKRGIDPRAVLKQQHAKDKAVLATDAADELRKELTLKYVFEAWADQAKKVKQSTKTLYRKTIEKHLEDWLDLPLADITSDMVCDRFDKVVADLPTAASALNAFRALRRLYRYAIDRYENDDKEPLLKHNPVSALSKRDKWIKLKPRSEKWIKDDELKAWYEAVRSLENDFTDYFVLLLLTGLRKSEALGLIWSDIDFKQGWLTARDTKNKTDHTIPMTNHITDLLTRRKKNSKNKSVFVFPGKGSKSGHIASVRLPQEQVIEDSKVKFTPHALRRTFAYAAERHIGSTQIKKLLNHKDSSNITENAYSPKDIDGLREPLQKVQDYLLNLAINGKKPKPPATKPKAGKTKANARAMP
jgi:integrase